ncbi:hypothetical protein [Amycolatopsis sp. FDAARGOS 1241]|uniref:hypothetical protein n=1 Tax=Amycolatopsis sp. FDAARGOS 1241 TaxID=2778070 RepID=UPI00194F7738|nr:hypothetical protein [Amycolatopsis sp. FDAARGOS 1241]QRP42755.1 hypothetical protein I6J71_25075 [Amycolatopsis sp. FDAARGOS 1241]
MIMAEPGWSGVHSAFFQGKVAVSGDAGVVRHARRRGRLSGRGFAVAGELGNEVFRVVRVVLVEIPWVFSTGMAGSNHHGSRGLCRWCRRHLDWYQPIRGNLSGFGEGVP